MWWRSLQVCCRELSALCHAVQCQRWKAHLQSKGLIIKARPLPPLLLILGPPRVWEMLYSSIYSHHSSRRAARSPPPSHLITPLLLRQLAWWEKKGWRLRDRSWGPPVGVCHSLGMVGWRMKSSGLTHPDSSATGGGHAQRGAPTERSLLVIMALIKGEGGLKLLFSPSLNILLIFYQVSAFSTWEKELHKIVFDPRYLLLNPKERKQVHTLYHASIMSTKWKRIDISLQI